MDWPFCIYGYKAKLAIVAVTDCEIHCVPFEVVKENMDTDLQFCDIMKHSTEEVYTKKTENNVSKNIVIRFKK